MARENELLVYRKKKFWNFFATIFQVFLFYLENMIYDENK